jgi:hypothetical protein
MEPVRVLWCSICSEGAYFLKVASNNARHLWKRTLLLLRRIRVGFLATAYVCETPSYFFYHSASRNVAIPLHLPTMSVSNSKSGPRYEYVSSLSVLHEDLISQMLFNEDGNWLAVGGMDGRLVIYEIPSLTVKRKLRQSCPLLCLCWDSKNTLLAGFHDGEVCIVERNQMVCPIICVG